MHSENLFDTQATIKVFGVGGAGSNAVNRMIQAGVSGVEFVSFNTDAQALQLSLANQRFQLGEALTKGLGAGGNPSIGENAAKESEKIINELLENTDMVFITAGMGGGTGTGAAPIIAEMARRKGILTVGVVTKPFLFEGPRRKRQAEEGAARLAEHVDTLICVPNDRLVNFVEKKTTMQEAFLAVDDVLRQGVQGISDIITLPGVINVDFADVKSVMTNAGTALMGLGKGIGDHRARMAAQNAASSPLLETSIEGAKRLLVNISAGDDFSIGESYEAMEYILQFTDPKDADIIMGHVLREGKPGEIEVTLLAAGMTGVSRGSVPSNTDVFSHSGTAGTAGIPSGSAAKGQPAPQDKAGIPIEPDELNLDIPSFLRQRGR